MKEANKSIQCSVTQCTNHCQDKAYCSLDAVQIASHEGDPKVKQCVDCMSFEKK